MMDRAQAQARARALVEQMTLEEQASQLRYDAPAIPRLGVPAYNWWNEALHGVARAGVATMFPQAIGLGAAFDPELMERIGRVIGLEGRAKYNEASARGDRNIYKGLTFWAPNVNIFRDPRWGRGQETYGEDPTLTARLAVGFIRGVQGQGEYLLAAACAKHFAVHSGPEALRHSFDARATPRDMEETYLPAFEACVREGRVEAVMGAYNRTNGEVCCASPALQKILRGDWGFAGHFVSDCWAVADFHSHHKVTARPEESVRLALENGCDLNCGCTYQKILNAVAQGVLDPRLVTRSCVRLFTTRFMLGLFDKTEYDGLGRLDVETPEHLALAEQAARESLVLLKNDGLLPLALRPGLTIGVIGPNANSRRALVGNYHGTASRYVTVLEGIQDAAAAAGARVLYAEGSDLFRPHAEAISMNAGYTEQELADRLAADTPEERVRRLYAAAWDHSLPDRLAEAWSVADCADVLVLVTGLDETMEGEEGDAGNAYASGDRLDLALPAGQQRLLAELLDCGKPAVVVNMTGSAVDLRLPQQKAGAILQAWYPGAAGGRAVAQVLFGQASPAGKLPVTFYNSVDDLPPSPTMPWPAAPTATTRGRCSTPSATGSPTATAGSPGPAGNRTGRTASACGPGCATTAPRPTRCCRSMSAPKTPPGPPPTRRWGPSAASIWPAAGRTGWSSPCPAGPSPRWTRPANAGCAGGGSPSTWASPSLTPAAWPSPAANPSPSA